MGQIEILDRDMTSGEFERMQSGFEEHALDSGVEMQSSDRYGFVALDGDTFIGCASGLAYKTVESPSALRRQRHDRRQVAVGPDQAISLAFWQTMVT